MTLQLLERFIADGEDSSPHLYGPLFLLLLASKLLEFALIRGVEAVSELTPAVLDPQLVGSVVYALLGLTALAAIYSVARHLRGSENDLEPHDLVQLAGVAGMLLLVFGYVLHGVADLPVFPGGVVTALLTGGVTMALLAVVFTRVRGIDMRLELPDSEASSVVWGTVSLCALAGVAQLAVFVATRSPNIEAGTPIAFGPQLSLGFLLWSVVLPGVFVGLGNGVLYNGAVQEWLRDRLGPSAAVAAVTALVGVVGLSFLGVGLSAEPGRSVASVGIVVLLSLVAAILAARGARYVARLGELDLTPSIAAVFGVLVVALPLLGMAVTYPPASILAASGIGVTVVGAVTGVGYERTRSVWVPGIGFTAYHVVANAELGLAVLHFLA